jgi:hypothetical protein
MGYLKRFGQGAPIDQGNPVQTLVQTLVGMKERRNEAERRQRMEERLAEQDAMAAEDRAREMQAQDFEMQQKLEYMKTLPALIKASADAESMDMAPPAEQAKAIVETGPDGKKKTQFEGPAMEVLEQLQTGFKGKKPELPQLPGTEMYAPSIDRINPQDAQALPTTPEGLPSELPLVPSEAAPEVAPHQTPYERGTADLSLFGGSAQTPLENRDERLARLQQEAMVQPNVIAAMANHRKRSTMEERLNEYERKLEIKAQFDKGPKGRGVQGSLTTGLWRWNDEEQRVEIIAPPREKGEEKTKPPKDVIKEMRDIDNLSARTLNLASLPSSYQQEIAGWAPNIIRNFMSDLHKGEDDSFFEKYQKYDPAYFLFAAEMLKATQGGRPSDKDLEFYLEKMPRSDDLPEVKAEKIHWLLSQLKDKAASTKKVYGYYYDMSPFEDMSVPSKKDILALSGTHSAGGKAPVGTGNIKSITRIP